MARFTQSSTGDGSGIPGPQGPQGNPGADGADGTNGADFGIYYLGNYNSESGYVTDIAVVRGSDGQLYLAKASGQLGDPINYQTNGQWEIWIPKGTDGSDGADGNNGTDGTDALWNFTGEWVNGVDYAPGDVVQFGGSSYYAPTGIFSSYSPPNNGWLLVASKGIDGADGADGADANLDTGTTTINNYSPTWSGTGLSFTGTPATGSYVKIGNLVMIQIDVLFTNVSDFGTGQYSLTLPFASKYHTDVYGGSIHDVGETTDHYSIKGHLSPSSSSMTIWSLKSSAQDEPFDHNSPFILTTSDKFHMSFSYICE